MDITTYSRGGYEKHILLLANGEILTDITYVYPQRREVTNRGNFLTGTCWEGDAIKVASIKEVLDENKVEYTFPPVFKHVAECNRYHDCLLVESLVPGEEVELSVEPKPCSTMLRVTWCGPFFPLGNREFPSERPFMELLPEVMEVIYKVVPLKDTQGV